jgi:hypothetical protein
MNDYTYDEDVENNYQEDRVPDLLNPLVGQDCAMPLPRPALQEVSNVAVQQLTMKPRKRTQPQLLKKKVCLTVFTASTISAPALLTH